MKKTTNWREMPQLGVSVQNRNDYADYDYIHKLNKKDLRWLKGFHREYVNADFQHSHIKHYTTKKARRIIYGLNNSRNRDAFSISKVQHKLYLNGSLKMDVVDKTFWFKHWL